MKELILECCGKPESQCRCEEPKTDERLLSLVKSKYKPDGENDEIYTDIGEFKAGYFMQGARAQLKHDRQALKKREGVK